MHRGWIIGIWVVLLAVIYKPCLADENSEDWKKDMVLIPAGEFLMGSPAGEGMEIEHPQHKVYLDAYWIDKYEVTNAQFAKFIEETGHITQAEWLGFGFVMTKEGQRQVAGANWRHPWGPRSSIEKRMDHPVVQVAWEDAASYAEWAGKRLPTEAEWEKAARGKEGFKYPWGRYYDRSKERIGLPWSSGSARVGSYPPNSYGLFDMGGNVIEWCSDWYLPDYYENSPYKNPQGPDQAYHRIARGGSWLFGDVSVTRAAFRTFLMLSWNNNIGFRCARNAEEK